MTPLERARAVADAVLYEGFLLYPYTASALKNRLRWQFGVLMPPNYADPSEPAFMETQMLAAAREDNARIAVIVRFLQASDVPTEREIAMSATLREGTYALPFDVYGLFGKVWLNVVRDGEYFHVTLRVENETLAPSHADRNEALRQALIGAHALLTIQGGEFVSLLDPPEEAKRAAAHCTNRRTFPVLTGEAGENGKTATMMLASPIILYDFPEINEKSPGHTFDNTEIDELLLLSVAAMTDEEKREARATDARARAIVDRADAMTAGLQQSLHGQLALGARVRVHPKRRADAFDMFADGKAARVRGVHEDVDGRKYVSVVFDDDPATDLHEWYGRSFFYEADEVEPLREGT